MTVHQELETSTPTLTKEKIAEQIQKKIGFPMKESKELLEMIIEEIKAKLEHGENVKMSGFGKWSIKDKRSRPGRNPHTGDKMEITARRVVTFHPSDRLRALVNQEEGQYIEDN